jgi:putative CocE/NonD family hydrolase
VQNKYLGTGRDGYDAIEWLAQLPYTDGAVGMWGTSYAAHTQSSAAILAPPHLKTIVLNMGGLYNGWRHKIRNHGAFELAQQLGWAFAQLSRQTNNPQARRLMQHETAADWVAALRARKGLTPLAAAPNFEAFIIDMQTRGDYDAYWKQPDINWSEHYAETADIPMLHISGWYDSYTAGAIHNFAALERRSDCWSAHGCTAATRRLAPAASSSGPLRPSPTLATRSTFAGSTTSSRVRLLPSQASRACGCS